MKVGTAMWNIFLIVASVYAVETLHWSAWTYLALVLIRGE